MAPGVKLGKHDLIRQIAVGGMAELYLARTVGIEGFEKLAVVKRILPQYASNASSVSMFLDEARLAATLHHPNIAQVYDIGQDPGEYFFSMEYVHGEDLGRMLRNAHESGVPISLDAALTLMTGLCAGLHHAHEKTGPDGRPLNVVHRDVSPSNMLVSYDGAVKLVDFGIARVNSTPGSTSRELKGKLSYMSPEQCRGKRALDRRSDVFSVGTILYELTTGQLPFTGDTEDTIRDHIVNTDGAPPSTLVPGYPPALEAIVMRALSREPDKRYNTTIDLQTDLEDFASESRLRMSPLVLARLMSNLFPARLEEWANARAQGAFFVEQHVVRTMIENSEVDAPTREGPPSPPSPSPPSPSPSPSDEEATAVTTAVSNEDVTSLRLLAPRAVSSVRTQQVRVAPPVEIDRPARPGMLSNQQPAAGDLTMHVRIAAPKKSRKLVLALAAIGASAAAVTYLVLSRDDGQLTPKDEKPVVTTTIKEALSAEPLELSEPPPGPVKPEDPKPTVVEVIEIDDTPVVTVPPPTMSKIRTVAKKPTPKRVAKSTKPEPKETQWKAGDSPFMPVRPDKR